MQWRTRGANLRDDHGSPAAHRTAFLPQQTTLRWPGHLPAPPVPRAGRARASRRGDLRAALPGTGARAGAARGAQPRPVPGRGPVPHAPAGRVPGLDRRAGIRHDEDRRVPRAAHLQPARAALAARPAGRVRPGARQPGAGLRPARPAPDRAAPGDQHPPPDQRGPADRAGRGARQGMAGQVALVLVRPDAGPGGPPGRADPDRLAVIPSRHLPRFPGRPGQGARDPARRGHPAVPPAHRTPGARPDRGRGQRGLAAQGGEHAAGGAWPSSLWSGMHS